MKKSHTIEDLFRRRHSVSNALPHNDSLSPRHLSRELEERLSSFGSAYFSPRIEFRSNAFLCPHDADTDHPSSGLIDHICYNKNLEVVTLADTIKAGYRGYTVNSHFPLYPKLDFSAFQEIDGCGFYMGLLTDNPHHLAIDVFSRAWCLDEITHESLLSLLVRGATKVNTETSITKRMAEVFQYVNSIKAVRSQKIYFVFNILKNADKKNLENVLFSDRFKPYLECWGMTRENTILLTQPTVFRSLLIPQASYTRGDHRAPDVFISQEADAFWQATHTRMVELYHPTESDKNTDWSNVYITDAQATHDTIPDNVERMLRKRNFQFVSVDANISVPKLHWILSQCDTLCGTPGAGLDYSLFLTTGSHVVSLTPRAVLETSAALENQLAIDRLRGHTHKCVILEDTDGNATSASASGVAELESILSRGRPTN